MKKIIIISLVAFLISSEIFSREILIINKTGKSIEITPAIKQKTKSPRERIVPPKEYSLPSIYILKDVKKGKIKFDDMFYSLIALNIYFDSKLYKLYKIDDPETLAQEKLTLSSISSDEKIKISYEIEKDGKKETKTQWVYKAKEPAKIREILLPSPAYD